MMGRGSKQGLRRGFTIVELLIVIVVIGILAAITIVAYNGIQNRAKIASLQTAVSQVGKKIAVYSVTNGDSYPVTLDLAGVTNSNGITYEYSVNNTVTPRTYCVTSTAGTLSYYLSSTNSTPTAGSCSGHSNGGVAATITNIIRDPRATSAWGFGSGTGGSTIKTLVSDARFPGGSALELAWTAAPSDPGGLYIMQALTANAQVGQRYFISIRYAASWSGASTTVFLNGPAVILPSETIVDRGDGTKELRTFVTADSTLYNSLNIALAFAYNQPLPTAGSTLRVGGIMMVAGDQYSNYSDGGTSGWGWTGTTNASTSTGPRQ